jgi:molybdate transport system regulatory protein
VAVRAKTGGPKIRLRVLLGFAVAIGPGKADLLTGIAETGSISAAGRRMKMSYKRAWQLIDTLNQSFRAPLVAAIKGGARGGGARLTPLGAEVLKLYREMEQRSASANAKALKRLQSLVVSKEPPRH